jgi:hypothetical protein
MERVDIGQAILIVSVCGLLGVLAVLGPPEHRTLAVTAAIGLVGTVAAAVRGRLVKRDPSKFKGGPR